MNHLSFCKEPMTRILYETPNAPKSWIIQVMQVFMLRQTINTYGIINGSHEA